MTWATVVMPIGRQMPAFVEPRWSSADPAGRTSRRTSPPLGIRRHPMRCVSTAPARGATPSDHSAPKAWTPWPLVCPAALGRPAKRYSGWPPEVTASPPSRPLGGLQQRASHAVPGRRRAGGRGGRPPSARVALHVLSEVLSASKRYSVRPWASTRWPSERSTRAALAAAGAEAALVAVPRAAVQAAAAWTAVGARGPRRAGGAAPGDRDGSGEDGDEGQGLEDGHARMTPLARPGLRPVGQHNAVQYARARLRPAPRRGPGRAR